MAYKVRNVTYKGLKNIVEVIYNNLSGTKHNASDSCMAVTTTAFVKSQTGKKFANPALKSSAEIGYNYLDRTKDFVSGLENIEN